jgi:hypothetical protein
MAGARRFEAAPGNQCRVISRRGRRLPMHMRKFARMALAKFFMIGCAIVFDACLAIGHAQAQFVNPVPTPPPPTFNPPSPYTTVPQAPYTPISPEAPSTLSGSSVGSHLSETPPSAATHPYRRAVYPTTTKSKVASVRSGHRSYWHHHWTPVVGPSYFPAGIGYVPSPYFCTWQREWDGYWEHRCF